MKTSIVYFCTISMVFGFGGDFPRSTHELIRESLNGRCLIEYDNDFQMAGICNDCFHRAINSFQQYQNLDILTECFTTHFKKVSSKLLRSVLKIVFIKTQIKRLMCNILISFY